MIGAVLLRLVLFLHLRYVTNSSCSGRFVHATVPGRINPNESLTTLNPMKP